MAKPRVNSSVFPNLPQSWEHYAFLHPQLNPQTISLNYVLKQFGNRFGTYKALAARLGISPEALSSAQVGEPLHPEALQRLLALLKEHGASDEDSRPLTPDQHIQPKLLDYFVPAFAKEPDFKKRGFGGDKSNGYSGYAIASHRRCCELQAFIVDGFPSELGKYPLHQHKGQEVLLCLEGQIDVYFWPISEPKRLTKNDLIYFDGAHPHQMISTTPDSRALSVISAPDGKSVEISVQKFVGVFPGQHANEFTPPRSIDTIDRSNFQIMLRKNANHPTCSPAQQAMATIEIMKHHEWREILKALGKNGRGITPQTISGHTAMNAELLNDLKRMLGREDATIWTGEFNIDKIVRSARVDTLNGTGNAYVRESHKSWYQSQSGAPRVVQSPIFGDDELNDTSVQLYPTVLHINKTTEPNVAEGHVLTDQGVEFWFVLEGKLGMQWEDPNPLLHGASGKGVLTEPHSALLYETGLKHVPFVPPEQTVHTKCLHVYFARSGGTASYRTNV